MLMCTGRKLNSKLVSTGYKAVSQCNIIKSVQFHSKILSSVPVQNICKQNVLIRPSSRNIESVAKDSLSYNIGSFFGNLRQNISKYMVQGVNSKHLYECCADNISYRDFFITCKMPDTFQSWFYVMALHIWMVLVRLRPEGKFGKNLSYYMVEIMWKDLEARVKLIGLEDTSQRKETMQEYTQQFFGLIVAYDEGLIGHDRVLASALWRSLFYTNENTDAESLALMVGYVRKQIQYLEEQDSEEILLTGKIKWLPLHEEKELLKSEVQDPS